MFESILISSILISLVSSQISNLDKCKRFELCETDADCHGGTCLGYIEGIPTMRKSCRCDIPAKKPITTEPPSNAPVTTTKIINECKNLALCKTDADCHGGTCRYRGFTMPKSCRCDIPAKTTTTTESTTTTKIYYDMCIPGKKCDDWPGGCGQAIGAGRCDVEVRKFKKCKFQKSKVQLYIVIILSCSKQFLGPRICFQPVNLYGN